MIGQGKKVAVLGLGVSGLAMALWCHHLEAEVLVLDENKAPQLLDRLPLQDEKMAFRCIELAAAAETVAAFGAQVVLLSPGIAPHKVAALTQWAKDNDIIVAAELWLFAAALRQLKQQQNYLPQVLAITGTNGKTTVTSLTAHLLQNSGQTVIAAGNIGISMLQALQQALSENKLPQYWVLELSSFQLYYARDFQPQAGVVLNVEQDHLDWHGSYADYVAAKEKIFASAATTMVVNADDIELAQRLAQYPNDKLFFALQEPQDEIKLGVVKVNDVDWLSAAAVNNAAAYQFLLPAAALKIQGSHNISNALAALALCLATGIEPQQAAAGLRSYAGEPHRTQLIAVYEGISFYDDSKATNVSATTAALVGLATERNIILILGGQAKGQDFAPLADVVSRHCKAVILIGQDAALIEKALAEHELTPLLAAQDMAQAVSLAVSQAVSGDIVLLSPACASFDMFSGYMQRGACFQQQVQQVTQEGLL